MNKECDCEDKTQCWEPCGDLGHDEMFAEKHEASLIAIDLLQNRNYNKEQFDAEYLCSFEDTTPQELYELGKKYHTICEEYDLSVCSYKNEKGVAVPTNNYEFILINCHAMKVRKDINRDGMLKGFSPKEIREVISEIGKRL